MCATHDPFSLGRTTFFHKAGAKGWSLERADRAWRFVVWRRMEALRRDREAVRRRMLGVESAS